ncbi:MAG TPA: hypothetical protein VN874_04030 [Myxococcales bacterium]|nr:hypothetical protein [Myxococcales bacterium]
MTCARIALVLVATVLLARCSSSTADLAPIAWQKVPGGGPRGSVLGLGSAGSFDERGNFTISAFKDGDVYKLYYGGADTTGPCAGINSAHWRIGLATSSDGLNWTRVPGTAPFGAILDIGTAGNFDDYLTYRPVVLKDGSVYRMWYNGSTKPFNCPTGTLADNRRIGYAESTDGMQFTRMYDGDGPGGSVLPLGAPGAIDGQQVGYVSVIKDGTEYKMFYSANDAANFWRVALAVSTDARHWTKVPGKLAGGAILDVGPAGSFDVACAYQPSVVKERDQLYRMWYRGCQAPGKFGGPSRGVIGYAESNDGRTWVKIAQNGPQGEALSQGAARQFDSGGLTTPSVFLDGSTWNMYYAGFDTSGVYLTGLARAPHR